MKTVLLLASLSMLLIAGCKKNTDEKLMPPGIYLSQIKYGAHDGQFRTLEYNNNGQLMTRTAYAADQVLEKLEYRYGSSGLTRIDVYSIPRFFGDPLQLSNTMTVEYQNGRISGTATIPAGLAYAYEYDGHDRISKITAHGIEKEYYYDKKGNITDIIDRNLNAGTFATIVFGYDDKINPTYRVDPINDAFGELDFIGFACPNNVVKSMVIIGADTPTVSIFNYTYNSDKLPLTSVEHYKDQSQEVDIYQSYKYEVK